MNSALEYFNEFVRPTVQEYFDNPMDRRRCLIAAILITHMSEVRCYLDNPQLKHASEKDKKDAVVANRHSAENKCSDLILIRETANVAKHFAPKSSVKIKFLSAISPRTPAAYGDFECGSSMLGDFEGGVNAWTDDGPKTLDFLVKSCFKFWENELQ